MGFILKILLGLSKFVLNILLLPINALINATLPDFSSYVESFTQFLDTYITSACSYFMAILPPMTRNLILFYVLVLISIYTISISVHAITKFFRLIIKIKFW